MLRITNDLAIPDDELRFGYSRSGGPGGQHVNKVNTRVTLYFDLENSTVFHTRRKVRLKQRLATRINKEGILRISCGRHRSQAANREEVLERFAALLREALKPKAVRRRTGIPVAEKKRRLSDKKKRSSLKRDRMRPTEDD